MRRLEFPNLEVRKPLRLWALVGDNKSFVDRSLPHLSTSNHCRSFLVNREGRFKPGALPSSGNVRRGFAAKMALDFAQERLAKTFQFLFAYSGNAAELG